MQAKFQLQCHSVASSVVCFVPFTRLWYLRLCSRASEKESIPRQFWFPGVTHRLRDGISNRKRSLKNVLVQLGRRCIFFGWRQTFLLLFFQFTGATVRQFSHLEMTANLCFYYCWWSLWELLLVETHLDLVLHEKTFVDLKHRRDKFINA